MTSYLGSDGFGPSSTHITSIHRAWNHRDQPQRQNSEVPMQDWEASGGKGKGKGWGYPNDQYGSGKGAKGRGHDNVWQGQAPSWNSGSDWYSW